MDSIQSKILLFLFLIPFVSLAQSGTTPQYSLELFGGAMMLEYDEIRLMEDGDYKSTYYKDGKEEIRYEKYMIFQLFREETPILEMEVIANNGYFLDSYFFIDEDMDLRALELANDDDEYFLKVCKDILISHPIIQDKTFFDWSGHLKVKELSKINSFFDDYAPMVSGDGETLFFLREGDPDNSMTFIHPEINNNKPMHFDQLDEITLADLRATGNDNATVRRQYLKEQQEVHMKFIKASRAASLKENMERSEEFNRDQGDFDSDIMVSRKFGGEFSHIIHQDFPLNDWAPNFIIGLSSDGKRIYTESKTLGQEYNVESHDINSFMEFNFQSETNSYDFKGNYISFEEMHNVFNASFFMTLNNNAILAGFQGDDTEGLGDIYISFRQSNGKFEYPQSVGTDINSELYEYDPFLAADLHTLYFSRRINEKETKIFVSRRLDDTWKNWSEPIALPSPINLPLTKNSGPFVTADGRTLYFESNRKRVTDRDIYTVELDDLLSPTSAPLVTGKVVYQGATLKGVDVEIQTVSGDKTKKQDISYAKSNPNGEYETPFRDNEQIAISATKKGYISDVVISDGAGTDETIPNVNMTKLEKGNRFTLKNILFKRSKSDFLPISIPDLENLKNVLLDNPNIRILIEGHTDSAGQEQQSSLEEKAVQLSEERARAVKRYLIKNGLPTSRIETKGFGSSRPRFSNDTEAGREKNRRVEVVIL